MLWFISPNAWYKVAGAAWWDFVAPHPLYARIFEPARRGFAAACLVARCLQSRYLNVLGTDLNRRDRFSRRCTTEVPVDCRDGCATTSLVLSGETSHCILAGINSACRLSQKEKKTLSRELLV